MSRSLCIGFVHPLNAPPGGRAPKARTTYKGEVPVDGVSFRCSAERPWMM